MSSSTSTTALISHSVDATDDFADQECRAEIPACRNSDEQLPGGDKSHSTVPQRWGRVIGALSGSAFAGYAASSLIHALFLFGLSVVVLPGMSGSGNISTLLVGEAEQSSAQAGGSVEFETRMDIEGVDRWQEQLQQHPEESLKPDESLTDIGQFLEGIRSPTQFKPFLNLSDGHGQGKQHGSGELHGSGEQYGESPTADTGGFAMPGSGKVVSKGSFVAWTIPEDPGPNENYLIVIQVKLPPKFKSIPLNDVTGVVLGTDGYRLGINAYTSRLLHKTRQIVLRIPGAESRIRDTIRIRSQILKEEQELVIEF